MWLCSKRSYNREVVGVEQRKPRAEFNSYFLNVALVYVNCFVNRPMSGRKKLKGNQENSQKVSSPSELNRHPQGNSGIQANAMETTERASTAAKAAHGYCASRG